MGLVGRLAGFAIAVFALLVVGIWSTPAEAHGAHVARATHQPPQPMPAATEIAPLEPARDAGTGSGCALDCCLGSATCVAHVAGPPVSAPVLPDPGSVRLQPAPGPALPGIVGERLPRPPRSA